MKIVPQYPIATPIPDSLPLVCGVAHGPERRVVIDEGGLIGEVRDDEEEQADERRAASR